MGHSTESLRPLRLAMVFGLGRIYDVAPMNAIEVKQLTKRYGSRVGIDQLSLSVPEGMVYGFLGPNGSGKTTAIRVLLGFLRPTSGQAQVFERDSWRDSARIKRQVGYVPGDLRLHTWMTGRSALKIAGLARGMDLLAKGTALADYFELELNVKVHRMSRGMRQKLGLILALVHEPRLLILDEPTSSLDPPTQERLYEHLRAAAGRGHTVFFSSHVLSEVDELCHRVAILRGGRLVVDESLERLRERAPRTVTIRWKTDPPPIAAPPPTLLEVQQRRGPVWECDLIGKVPELLNWLAGQTIDDVSIGKPNLDRLFRQYYESDNSV